MLPRSEDASGQFCWVDLAASDAASARRYYERLFGWTANDEHFNGGLFTRLKLAGHDVGSLYQLQRAHIERGVPSHWTPYVRVADADDSVRYAERLGGSILARPFTIPGLARIAVVLDPVGAPIGLWQPDGPATDGGSHG